MRSLLRWGVTGAAIGPSWAKLMGSPIGVATSAAVAIWLLIDSPGALRISVAASLVVLALTCKFWLRLPFRPVLLAAGLVGDIDEMDDRKAATHARVHGSDVERTARRAAADQMAVDWVSERYFRRMRRCIVPLIPFIVVERVPVEFALCVALLLAIEIAGAILSWRLRFTFAPPLPPAIARAIVAGIVFAAAVRTGLTDHGWPIFMALLLWIGASAADVSVRIRAFLLHVEDVGEPTPPPIRFATSLLTTVNARLTALTLLCGTLFIGASQACTISLDTPLQCRNAGVAGLRQRLSGLTGGGPDDTLAIVVLVVATYCVIAGAFGRGNAWRPRGTETSTPRRVAGEVADVTYTNLHSRLKPQLVEVIEHLEDVEEPTTAEAEALAAARRAQVVLARALRSLHPDGIPESGITVEQIVRSLVDSGDRSSRWEIRQIIPSLSTLSSSDSLLLEFVINDLIRNADQAGATRPKLEVESANNGKHIQVTVTCDCPRGAPSNATARGLRPLISRLQTNGGGLLVAGTSPHTSIAYWRLAPAEPPKPPDRIQAPEPWKTRNQPRHELVEPRQ